MGHDAAGHDAAGHDVVELERAAWRALSAGGDAAADHFDDVLADEVLMLLPAGMVIDDRRQAIDSMRGAPWDGVAVTDERVLELHDHTVVVAYRATARRGEQVYEALFNSTYTRVNGAWKLSLHQQTPV